MISPSIPSESIISSPNIWYPPQMPNIIFPLFFSSLILSKIPFCLITLKSFIVFLVPGIIIKSGLLTSSTFSIYLTLTSSILSKLLKSVKLEIWGSLITAISKLLTLLFLILSVTLSSSSISNLKYGKTPNTGIFIISSNCFIASLK